MADIINTPSGGNTGGGWVLGLVAIVLLVLVLIFLLPNIMNDRTTPSETENAADTNTEGTNNGGIFTPPPVTNNTIINSTTTINNSTTTDE